jgi:hypothetical protein
MIEVVKRRAQRASPARMNSPIIIIWKVIHNCKTKNFDSSSEFKEGPVHESSSILQAHENGNVLLDLDMTKGA